jgi:hypothetical protein
MHQKASEEEQRGMEKDGGREVERKERRERYGSGPRIKCAVDA